MAPVVAVFNNNHDRDMVFTICREKLSSTGMVMTMDSRLVLIHSTVHCLHLKHGLDIVFDLCRSRVAFEEPKDIPSSFNFSSFLAHFKEYQVAQDMFNKMVIKI